MWVQDVTGTFLFLLETCCLENTKYDIIENMVVPDFEDEIMISLSIMMSSEFCEKIMAQWK